MKTTPTMPTTPTSTAGPVLVDDDAAVRTITLNRPEKRNAICSTLQREVIEVVERGADDPTAHVVIIRGAGRRHRKGRPQRPLTAIRPLLAKTTARQRRPARP